jgi:PP-loop superfamily ATP-utilizing enzyme
MLTVAQNGAYYTGIKVYNNLPSNIKCLIQEKRKIKSILKNFLLTQVFYSLEEYFNTDIK